MRRDWEMESQHSEDYNINDSHSDGGRQRNGSTALRMASRIFSAWGVPELSPRASTQFAEHRKSRGQAAATGGIDNDSWEDRPSRGKRYSEMQRVASAMQRQSVASNVVREEVPTTDRPKHRKSYAEMRKSSSSSSAAPKALQAAAVAEAEVQDQVPWRTASSSAAAALQAAAGVEKEDELHRASNAEQPRRRYSEMRKERLAAESAVPSARGSLPTSVDTREAEVASARWSTEQAAASSNSRPRYSQLRKSQSLVQVPREVGGGGDSISIRRMEDSDRQMLEDFGYRLKQLENGQHELRGSLHRIETSVNESGGGSGKSKISAVDIEETVRNVANVQEVVRNVADLHIDIGERVKFLEEEQTKMSQQLDNVEKDLARHFAGLRDELKVRIQASEQRLLAKVHKDVEDRLSSLQIPSPPVLIDSLRGHADADDAGSAASSGLGSTRSSARQWPSVSSAAPATAPAGGGCDSVIPNHIPPATRAAMARGGESARNFLMRSKSAIQEAEEAATLSPSEASVSSEMSRRAFHRQSQEAQQPGFGRGMMMGSETASQQYETQGRSEWRTRASMDRVPSRQLPTESRQSSASSRGFDAVWEPGSKDSEGRLVF